MIDPGIRPQLGIIGGLGPLASADFYFKLTRMTEALRDSEHVPAVILSVPQLPDRTEAILGNHDGPLAPLQAAVSTLNALGVACIAMPCNTAHHWYGQLAADSRAEIIHIGDAVVTEFRRSLSGGRIANLATRGTLVSGFYQDRIAAAGFDLCLPANAEFQERVDSAIALVKGGSIADAATETERALHLAQFAGADAAVLGCTELSVVAASLNDANGLIVIDSNAALARACLTRLGFGVQEARGLPTALRMPGHDRLPWPATQRAL
ncbi:aspartate/glutamate racemase family protein [Mesorhizobium sp. M1C.F.Ca.ET.193.01.1.1]|uniref:aspartate/glutamate racemase family protein n=1 Tax=unclassified Mesorhizobium TaxID=325217 RepID=UPI000FD416A4|nr:MULTISPECIES: amino acid racemase [unclassified Mesorhizobium]TGS98245.1 aspartate/glutamate racemase family protein [bacterium M00.F.Ca.ET.177.01.1.1]TGQ52651.1 aspartate/glutamate racemase family protein [Mesorhizobium sp. M1C.F.Ca.ET.210.01.1.1]TGQ70026.1 aspartate/glutamate racemase family protein [Mesorhizobium sp. M1C.F.Ca.ET.212.01.1.1]TGR05519.1 aspartate/glutamate racemase family protein [Mesorhizobium sp. M1C.F.Ca.ET.204.01.1.1]TGR26262.1 aspartate/glutamate racemase family protei